MSTEAEDKNMRSSKYDKLRKQPFTSSQHVRSSIPPNIVVSSLDTGVFRFVSSNYLLIFYRPAFPTRYCINQQSIVSDDVQVYDNM